MVHMALLDEASGEIAVVSLACGARFPTVSGRPSAGNPPGARRSTTCSASRRRAPWTSGRGSITASGVSEHRSRAQPRPPAAAEPYVFLPVEGESLHQIPVGPVHAGIIEPGHFRFSANGETVVRLEERLGYVHKGIEALMAGRRCRARRAAGRAHLGRQHGGLRARVRPGGGSRSGHRGAAARGLAARAHGRDASASPIISATSARSATTPRLR